MLDISHCVIRASSIQGCIIAFVPYNIKFTGDSQHAWQVLQYLKFHNSQYDKEPWKHLFQTF